MEKQVLKDMFDNLLHIWNKSNYWNPKMRNYIYASSNWVHVFDLTKTYTKLEELKKVLEEETSKGKKILFVATKLQSRHIYEKLAIDTWSYYVSEKWVPGLLTNFRTIRKRINAYVKLLKDRDTWALDVLTKKEKANKLLILEKLDKAYKWLKDMRKVPDIIFVTDWVYDKQALAEAKTLKLKTLSIMNTNWDIDSADFILPASTNSIKSLSYIANAIAPSIKKDVPSEKKNFVKKVAPKKTNFEKGVKVVEKEETYTKDENK